MTSIELTSITGLTPPYIVYACDVYGAVCTPIASISTFVPPPNNIVLPPAFAFAPAVGIKIETPTCTRFEVFFCTELFPQYVCLKLRISASPPIYISQYFSFTIDENINGKPSWIGSYLGTPQTLYWDGSQWIIDPLGITNSNEDLYFGLWLSVPPLDWYVQNSYCPSICILLFDGVSTTNYNLQYIVYDFPLPIGSIPIYLYDDGINLIRVIWDILNNQWILEVNSVLTATIPTYTDDDIPLGSWVLEPGVPYVNITTVLECPLGFKQFQNTEDFYFMDSSQYNFQS